MTSKLREDLRNILEVEDDQIRKIQSDFLRRQAKEIRRMAEKGEVL